MKEVGPSFRSRWDGWRRSVTSLRTLLIKYYKQRPLPLHICVVLVLTSNCKCQGQSHGSARVSSRGSNNNGKFSSLRSRECARFGVSAMHKSISRPKLNLFNSLNDYRHLKTRRRILVRARRSICHLHFVTKRCAKRTKKLATFAGCNSIFLFLSLISVSLSWNALRFSSLVRLILCHISREEDVSRGI